MDLRILHSGDLHADTSYHGGTNPATGLPTEWESNLRAIDSMVQGALDYEVDAVILPGDFWRTGTPRPEAILLLAEALMPLARHGIPTVLVSGNHDLIGLPPTQRTAVGILAGLLRAGDRNAEIHLVDRDPALVTTSTGVQVVALPWLGKSNLLADNPGLADDPVEADRAIASEATAIVERLCEKADFAGPVVLASHATVDDVRLDSIDGAARRGSETTMTHLFAEPILPRRKLEEFGFSYAGLSHIHIRQRLSDTFHYPGSTNRHTLADCDRPKSANLVDLDETGCSVSRIPLAARPMTRLDLGTAEGLDRISDLAEGTIVDLVLEPGQSVVDKVVAKRLEQLGVRIARTRVAEAAPPPDAPLEPDLLDATETTSPMEALPVWLADRTDDVERVMRVAATITEGAAP